MRFARPQLTAFVLTAALLLAGVVGVTHWHPHSHDCGCDSHAALTIDSHDHSAHVHSGCSHSDAPAKRSEPATNACCSGHHNDAVATNEGPRGAESQQNDQLPKPTHDHDDCVICQLLAQSNAVSVPAFEISLLESATEVAFQIPVSATTTLVVCYDVRGPPVA